MRKIANSESASTLAFAHLIKVKSVRDQETYMVSFLFVDR